MMKVFTVRLEEEIVARLDALAAKTNRSKAFYTRLALTTLMDKMENVYSSQEKIVAVDAGRVQMVFGERPPRNAAGRRKNR